MKRLLAAISLVAALAVGGSLVWGWLGAQAAADATFTVDSEVDAVDANPGDGTCAASAGGCTLRAAIQEANALPGADAITLPEGTYTLGIPGTEEDGASTGDLDITGTLTITGAGPASTVIDGGALDRVFHVRLEATVTISDVTIQNGDPGVAFGGGILNQSTLTLSNSTVSANSSGSNGGGIYSDGTLTVSDSTITGNSGDRGGGIWNFGPSSLLTVTDSAIADNSTTQGPGGGIGAFGTTTITGTTISGNNAASDGGGIEVSGDMTLTNSTVSGNTADDVGGGIHLAGAGTLTLDSVTITANTSGGAGGGIQNFANTVNAKNSLIAGNTNGSGSGPDCFGSLTSQGHNLIQDPSGCNIGGDTATNITGQDPLLLPLADNGGPTQTHALPSGSPALDDIDAASCPATDQRGIARPQGTACDIGAYELVVRTVTIPPGGWANFAWTGDGAPQDVADCFDQGNVAVMYRLDADTQTFDRWFAGRAELTNMTAVDRYDTLLALNAGTQAATCTMPDVLAARTLTLPAGSWANFAWTGAAAPAQTVADCFGQGNVAVMYRLDAQTQLFDRWIGGRAELSNMGEVQPYDALLALNGGNEAAACQFPS